MNETTEAVSAALETVAIALENRAGNKIYKMAWRAAAKVVRAHKPKVAA